MADWEQTTTPDFEKIFGSFFGSNNNNTFSVKNADDTTQKKFQWAFKQMMAKLPKKDKREDRMDTLIPKIHLDLETNDI